MWFAYEPLLTEVLVRVAGLIGAQPDECVFVANVATGINTVIRNFEWCEDDILVISTWYERKYGLSLLTYFYLRSEYGVQHHFQCCVQYL